MTKFFFFRFFFAGLFALAAQAASFAQMLSVPAGTELTFELNETRNATELTLGNTLKFKVRGDGVFNEKVIVRTGAEAIGRVTDVDIDCDGNCSRITIEVRSVKTINGNLVPVSSEPFTVQTKCCTGKKNAPATVKIGTTVVATLLNNEKIKA
jgi:sporulation protein YlmC with PRC-barrel domain